MNPLPEKNSSSTDRWILARDIGVLQAKLLVDGLRDLLLVPASLITGLVSLLSNKGDKANHYFYQLLDLGKQSEHWINLFGALKNAPADLRQVDPFPQADMDELVGRLETFMVEEHNRGGITAQAKDRMDKVIKAINRRRDSERRED
jgi:hypothetical protein